MSQPSNMNRTLVGNTIIDHSDVVGASPTISPLRYFFIYHYDISVSFENRGDLLVSPVAPFTNMV